MPNFSFGVMFALTHNDSCPSRVDTPMESDRMFAIEDEPSQCSRQVWFIFGLGHEFMNSIRRIMTRTTPDQEQAINSSAEPHAMELVGSLYKPAYSILLPSGNCGKKGMTLSI